MAITLGGRSTASSDINVTPLIDVLLVLLIIFMVLPQRSVGEAAEIPLKASGPPRPVDPTIVIQLQQTTPSERPTLKINQGAVSWEKLEAELQKIYLRRVEKVAFLKGDPDIDYRYVAEVIDKTHHAGVTHVGLLGQND